MPIIKQVHPSKIKPGDQLWIFGRWIRVRDHRLNIHGEAEVKLADDRWTPMLDQRLVRVVRDR